VRMRTGALLLISIYWIAQLGAEAKFINRLHEEGYVTLSVRFYEEAIKDGSIPKREHDAVFLKLYKGYNKMASMSKDEKKVSDLRAKAESYFERIKSSDDPEIKLERVATDMEALKTIERKSLLEGADLESLKRQAKEPFGRVVEVTDGIRLAARKWLEEYDEMEDKDRRKLRRDYQKQTGMEINSSLKFGEACVIYASLMGHEDSEVKKWLEKMAKTYNEFINNYFGSFPAVVGSIYYGQACILLGTFNDGFEDVDGTEAGRLQFEEAIASLEEFEEQRNLRPYVLDYMYQAYTKHAKALEIVGELEKSIDVHKKLFEWKTLSEAKPSKGGFHDLMMYALQGLCKKLQTSYDGGQKERVNDLMKFVLEGYNFTKKYKSKWHRNFEVMLKSLPTDDPGLVETTDIAYNKAKDLFNEAKKIDRELNKAKKEDRSELKVKIDSAFFKTAMKYKKTLELLVLEDDEDKFNDIYPDAAFSMGYSLYKTENYLLSLTTFLRAVELYPSKDYPEDKYPEIYQHVSKCAKYAKGAATNRYTKGGGQDFDKDLFEKTLNIIKEQFPEEGSDPEYLLAFLQKKDEKYKAAKEFYSKINQESKMYFKAQFGIVDCDYLALSKSLNENPLEGTALKEALAPVVLSIEKFIEICKKEVSRPVGMDDKDFKSLVTSQEESKLSAYRRLSSLYYKNEDYKKTHEVQTLLLKNLEGKEADRFASFKKMVSCSYRLDDEDRISGDITGLKGLKPQKADPTKGIKELADEEIKEFIANALRMQANIVIAKEINPMIKEQDGLTGPEREAHAMKMAPFYLKAGELFYESLEVADDRDEGILKQVIAYFYTAKTGREKALDALKLYFKWYPEKPVLDEWAIEMRGKDRLDWHGKIFGDPKLKIINLPNVQKIYDRFLDEIFDTIDYSGMTLSDLQKKKRELGDRPRNYQSALDTLELLNEKRKTDALFNKEGWPKLEEFKQTLKEANNYYGFRFMQAECYSILGRYEEAKQVYLELANYFVEYAQIRIELAKAKFTVGTPDSLAQAQTIFSGLLKVVPGPNNRKAYKPRDFFSLQMWSARTKLKSIQGKDTAVVIKTWKYLRSAIYQDLDYFRKRSERYRSLKIPNSEVPAHETLVDEIKAWVSEEIFPIIKESGDKLSGDSWKKILGEDA